MLYWIVVIITVLSSVGSLLLLRLFTINRNWWILALAGVLSIILLLGYFWLFRLGSIGITYGIITGTAVALLALGEVIFFKEKLAWTDLLALGLIIGGVILLAAF